MHEQLDPDDLQDHELVRLQPSPEAVNQTGFIGDDLVPILRQE